MTDESRDLVQGTLEMLVLKTLALEPMHGYGIALRIEQISAGVFRVNPGSLLPALSRVERAGRVWDLPELGVPAELRVGAGWLGCGLECPPSGCTLRGGTGRERGRS